MKERPSNITDKCEDCLSNGCKSCTGQMKFYPDFPCLCKCRKSQPEAIPSTWLKVNKCYLKDKVGDVLTIQKICDDTTIHIRPHTSEFNYYFNCNRGAKASDFKVGASYKIVKEEQRIISDEVSNFWDMWLEEVPTEPKPTCPVCGEVLDSNGSCEVNQCKWIKDEEKMVTEPLHPDDNDGTEDYVFCHVKRCYNHHITQSRYCSIHQTKPYQSEIITVICVTPWMGLKSGDIVVAGKSGKKYDGVGGRWLKRIGDNQLANVEDHPSLKEDNLYEIVTFGKEVTLKLKGSVPATEHSVEAVKKTLEPITAPSQEDNMNGTIYKGVVVRNKVVPQGEGVSTGATISEVLFESPKAFIAANEQMARAKVLVDAKLSLKEKLDLEDVLQPVEVKLTTVNG